MFSERVGIHFCERERSGGEKKPKSGEKGVAPTKMSSIVVCGGSCGAQVRFINWLIGAPLIPVGNAGRSVIVWHVVDGNEESEKVNVVVHYRKDLGLAAHDDVFAQVLRKDLNGFLGLVVEQSTYDGRHLKLGLGFMVDAIHVALRVNLAKRKSVWANLRITQLPDRHDTIDIGRWLGGASHIVVMTNNLSEDFERFEQKDKETVRHRLVVTEYVAGDPVACVLGGGGRWTLTTIKTDVVVPLGALESRWLRWNELYVRDQLNFYLTEPQLMCKDKRPYVVSLLAMNT